MTFLSGVRLPTFVERNAQGGQVFNNTSRQLFSGHRRATQNWTNNLAQWDIAFPVTELDDASKTVEDVIAVWMAAKGNIDTFRFKAPGLFEIRSDQVIGTADGTTTEFPIYRLWEPASGSSYQEPIGWMVSGEETVKVNGVTQTAPGDYSLTQDGTSQAKVTFVAAPSAGSPAAEITIAGQYDYIVHFNESRLIMRTLSNVNLQVSVPRLSLAAERLT